MKGLLLDNLRPLLDVLRIRKHQGIYLGWLMKALNKFFIVQEFVLISLSTGEQELCLRLGVVFVALHGLVEVPLGDDTCHVSSFINL